MIVEQHYRVQKWNASIIQTDASRFVLIITLSNLEVLSFAKAHAYRLISMESIMLSRTSTDG